MAGRWTKRLLKVGGYGLGVLVLLLVVGVTMTVGWRPFIGPRARPLTARRFEPTAARLERGRYLVENVSGCFLCHSSVDWRKDPAKSYAAAKKGAGSTLEQDGMPWLTAPNITPDEETGAGRWTDDMFARAIREGVGHDGRALFPMMPYGTFSNYSDEDLASVVVYLRSIEPVRNALPKSEIPFPLSKLINDVPRPIEAPVPEPDRSSPVKYGAYLVKVADCAGCHTPRGEKGEPLAGLEFGGGNVFDMGEGRTVATANLTPDPTGISYYDEALFVSTIRTGHVKARKLSPMMPWWYFKGMKDEDLKAIFSYLSTLRPVDHHVDNAEPPTYCKRCKHKHGLGDRN